MDSIVSIEHLFFSYDEAYVLKDVNLQIAEGQFIGVIGPNGGGKTTLLKLMMGFLTPTSGSIRVLGLQPSKASTQVAYVPQSMRYDRLFPISVMELVLMGRLHRLSWYGKYSTQDKDAAINALNRVGLSDFKDASFGTLSGGQAQRALIARALVTEPRLLLLDEPTANVDSQAEADIYALLHQLKGKMTILMVTHDLRAAVEQVDRVICVQNQVMTMDPSEVCEHFAIGLYHAPIIPLGSRSTPLTPLNP